MKGKLRLLLYVLLFLVYPILVNSQTLATCSDLQVSTGAFTPAWKGYYGRYTENNNPCGINYSTFEEGILNTRHIIRKPSDGLMPCYGDNLIPYVPTGYGYAIQLGNDDDGREWERLETTFSVTDENSLIEINLALFFEDHGHPVCKQPKFWIKILDENNEIILNADYLVIAAGNLTGWQTSLCPGLSPIRYLPWTKMSIDLRDYKGKNITLQFQSMDCSEGGHFGFGIFAIRCLSSQITSSPFCANNNNITLSAPSGFAKYVWNTGDTTSSIMVTTPVVGQHYSVALTPFSSLNSSDSILVEYVIPPVTVLNMSSDTFFCQGTGVNLNASIANNSFNFEWSNGNIGNSIFVDSAGIYSVTATHTDGCILEGVVEVTENKAPQYQIDIVNPVCNGGEGRITINPSTSEANYSYLWSNSQMGAVQDVLAGSYYVTVTDVNTGCTASDTIHIIEPSIAVLEVNSCQVCAPQGSSYNWYLYGSLLPNYTTRCINIQSSGQYSVKMTDSFGCVGTTSDTVFAEPFVPVVTAQNGSLCAPEGGSNYQWYLNGSLLSGQSSNCITNLVLNGNYYLQMTDAYGCEGISTPLVTSDKEANTLINPIRVYPNPTTGELQIDVLEQMQIISAIQIFDINGKYMLSKNIDTSKTLNVEQLSSGVYWIQLTTEYGIWRTKIIKI